MKSIRIFLLKGKESMIDHVKSIQTLGCAYWKKARNKNLQVGDICYLYLIGKGHYQIRFRLEVVDIVVLVKTILVGLLHSKQITTVINSFQQQQCIWEMNYY